MPVLYNGTAIVPAPFMTVTEQIVDTSSGIRIGKTYEIVLHGTLVAAPPRTALDMNAHLGSLLAAQDALSHLFGTDGKIFEVYSPDGSSVTKCNPRVKGLEFQEGNWFNKTDYTVTLEADTFYPSDIAVSFVSEASDSWQIEEAGAQVSVAHGAQPIWKITHNISAKGKTFYDSTGALTIQPWEQARNWVINRLLTSTIDTAPFDSRSELNLQASNAWNHLRVESVDILEASFSITETWILAYNSSASEDYSINVRLTPEESQSTTTAVVSGTIKGFSTSINDYATRNSNAKAYLFGTVQPDLINRVNEVVTWTSLNSHGISGTLDYNLAEGTIAYSYEFNDRPTSSDQLVYDTWTVEKKTSLDSYETTVTVSGTVVGRLDVGEANASLLKFDRAKAYFNALLAGSSIYKRAQDSAVAGLKQSTSSSNISNNYFEGSISYSYEFSDRPFNLAENDYELSMKFDKNDGRVTAGISGTVKGLKNSDTDSYTVKYINAKAFFTSFQPTIYSLVSAFAGPSSVLNTIPISVSRGDNVLNGTIQYAQDYDNQLQPNIPNALSENVTITDTGAIPVVATLTILGRTKGPLFQNINTVSARTRTVAIDYQMIYGSAEPDIDGIIYGYAPSSSEITKNRDEKQWDETTFHGSRTVEWAYNA